MIFIIDRKRYNTEAATVLAHNQDHNSTRWTTLMRTPKGAYIIVRHTLWQGEVDTCTILTEAEAADEYTDLLYPEEEWEECFPNVPIEEG